MSHNLTLRSAHQEFGIFQTPTDITRIALRTGSLYAAADTYERWLRGCTYDLEGYDYASGWSWDAVTRHIAMVDAFIAFAPSARFYST